MIKDVFKISGHPRFFDDYTEGMTLDIGSFDVTESGIVDCAQRFDPQFFHTDREKAKEGPFGGLIASGWHTASMTMRVITEFYLSDTSSLGSPGLDNLRWAAPVRPGDVLSVHTTTIEARQSASKPDRGIVKTLVEVRNQSDVTVLDFTATNFIACRP